MMCTTVTTMNNTCTANAASMMQCTSVCPTPATAYNGIITDTRMPHARLVSVFIIPLIFKAFLFIDKRVRFFNLLKDRYCSMVRLSVNRII